MYVHQVFIYENCYSFIFVIHYSLENQLATKAENLKNVKDLENVREDVVNAFSNRLKELGVDPKWKTLPSKTYKEKSETAALQRTQLMKVSYNEYRY